MKIQRKPEWLQKKVNPALHAEMDRLLGSLRLHTVCREAACPNISECFGRGEATFLILGAACTRSCTFCNVAKEPPLPPDPDEPVRVAEAVRLLGLRHVVITSPTRDDLGDGGASHYAATVAAIRTVSPETTVELLVPDFAGDQEAVASVVAARPDVFGHNMETVPRLYSVRTGADYSRSLAVLRAARELDPDLQTKSGIMLGLGETLEEVHAVLRDLRTVDCRWLGIGQYLAPSRAHQSVAEFIPPERFDSLRDVALQLGFTHVESAPYVRSSYHAGSYGSSQTCSS